MSKKRMKELEKQAIKKLETQYECFQKGEFTEGVCDKDTHPQPDTVKHRGRPACILWKECKEYSELKKKHSPQSQAPLPERNLPSKVDKSKKANLQGEVGGLEKGD